MKSSPPTASTVIAAVFSLLLVGTVVSYLLMGTSYARAAASTENVTQCLSIIERIERLRQTPQRADIRSQSETELAGRIEEAAAQADLPRNNIVRIDPGEPRRLTGTDYKKQPTDVELRSVSLKSLITFLHTVAENSESQADFLWLTSTRTDEQSAAVSESWNAQLTLSNLIFSPRN